ncbi:transposase IS66, partial [Rhizobium sp. Pop5]
LGRKSWLFAGSDRGADRAAFMATLIMTAKLNDIDPQVWLADVLARIADTSITRLEQSVELDAADRQRSSGLTCGLHRRLTTKQERRCL